MYNNIVSLLAFKMHIILKKRHKVTMCYRCSTLFDFKLQFVLAAFSTRHVTPYILWSFQTRAQLKTFHTAALLSSYNIQEMQKIQLRHFTYYICERRAKVMTFSYRWSQRWSLVVMCHSMITCCPFPVKTEIWPKMLQHGAEKETCLELLLNQYYY